jgi:hypothetical protein
MGLLYQFWMTGEFRALVEQLKYEKTRRKTCPSVHHRSHRTTLGLNLGLYGEKLVTKA